MKLRRLIFFQLSHLNYLYFVGCVELHLLIFMSWFWSQTFIWSCISSYLEVIQYLMVWLPPGPSVSDILDHTGSSLSALDSIFIFICYIKLHHACFVAITCVRYFVQQLPTLMRCCPILLKLPCPLLLVMFGMSPVWLVLISCMCHLCVFSYPIFSPLNTQLRLFCRHLFIIYFRCIWCLLSRVIYFRIDILADLRAAFSK